jgi:hypothetical protein
LRPKAIAHKGNRPKMTRSQGTKSAISKVLGAANIMTGNSPALFPLASHYRSSDTKDIGAGGER